MNKVSPSSTTPSFFDDIDSKTPFDFLKPSSKHEKHLNTPPIFGSILACKGPSFDEPKTGFYALHGLLLAYFENEFANSCNMVLELSNSKLKPLFPSQSSNDYGFELVKNGVTFEFQLPDKQVAENWINVLTGICVLTDFHDKYKASKMIGKGSFAKVYLVESKVDGKQYAVKAFAKSNIGASDKSNPKGTMLNEINIMRDLDHENIIKLYEVHETEKSIYLVMELIQGKPLQSPLTKLTFKKDFTERQIIEMVRSILDALAYMASKGIMHRDLKPDNILIDKAGKIKIVDFGLATYINENEYIFKKCGTPGYIAPEIFKYNPKVQSTAYDDKCDVFSAGCILFYMLFGYPFFDGSGASEILQLNREFSEFEAVYFLKKEIKNSDSKINKNGIELLLKLLEYDHKKRSRAVQALEHPFLITGDRKVFNRALSYGDCSSPLYAPANVDSLKSELSEKGTPLVPSGGNRYTEKDSLYLDVGRPELNGKVDTITNGSANNSLLMKGSNDTSNNNSISAFAKQSNTSEQEKESKGQNKTFRGACTNQSSFLKAAILYNIQKNNEVNPETGKTETTRPHHERRHTDITLMNKEFKLPAKRNSSPGNSTSDLDNLNDEDTQIGAKMEKANERIFHKHPSKLMVETGKAQYFVQ